MIITKIERQKKDKQRYSIYLDGEFSFGLYDDTILKFGLRSNDEIDDEILNTIKEYDELNFAKKIAYAYLSYKPRSEKDIKGKLKQKKISENAIESVIKLLKEQKYLDDENYAKQFLESKISRKPIGKRILKQKLFEKGIEKETAENILNEYYSEEKEMESAKKLLSKYEKKIKSEDEFERKRKCFQYLVSRGFDYETVKSVINKIDK